MKVELGSSQGHSLDNLLACVTFHYNPSRLDYLRQTCAGIGRLARKTLIVIITNAAEKDSQIREELAGIQATVMTVSPTFLGHPFLLAWVHLDVFREFFFGEQSFTHFLYAEDDILIRPENIAYWMEGRELLRHHGLIPSFLRYERNPSSGDLYSTDSLVRASYRDLPRLQVSPDGYEFVCLPNPYQGMYLLDRELLDEHLSGPSSSPDFGRWRIRERAAQGITFLNVPRGFTSRNLIGCLSGDPRVDPRCLIEHLPANYVADPSSPLARFKVDDIFASRFEMAIIRCKYIKMRLVRFAKDYVCAC
jgi:hypothetical protein